MDVVAVCNMGDGVAVVNSQSDAVAIPGEGEAAPCTTAQLPSPTAKGQWPGAVCPPGFSHTHTELHAFSRQSVRQGFLTAKNG